MASDDARSARSDAAIVAVSAAADTKSLALLAAKAVALARPLEEIAACLDYFPLAVRRELYTHMTHERLRGLEVCWTRAQPQGRIAAVSSIGDEEEDGWQLYRETEGEWHARTKSGGGAVHTISNRIAGSGTTRKRSFREAFWEHRFRSLLRARVAHEQWRNESTSQPSSSSTTTTHIASVGPDAVNGAGALTLRSHSTESRDRDCDDSEDASMTLHLFRDVVRHLKVHGREVIPRNVALMRTLQQLQRLEVHHPEQQCTCWRSLVQLIETHPSLAELCFFHGKLSDVQLEQIRRALQTRALTATSSRSGTSRDGDIRAIATLELVSIKIRERGHSELVALLRECRELTAVRLSNCLTGFANDCLIGYALQLPRLELLSLEHNDLEDDAFAGVSAHLAPIALQRLKLDSNAISVATLRGICTATLDGFLSLQRLVLRNNVDVGDASIHALAPMLASAGVALTHLDLYNCSFGLEGATTLLLALGTNTSLTHLDIGHNFFGSRFGDLLATFLRVNASLQSLRMNYVGLGTAGCTEQLRDALVHNHSLIEVAVGANRLRDDGADVLFQAFVQRSRALQMPYALIDLSGNLLTHKALGALASTVERESALEEEAEQQRDGRRYDQAGSNSEPLSKRPRLAAPVADCAPRCCWIRELSLLDNNFPRDVDANERAVALLRTRVEVVRTNTWVGKRNVYDDEV